MTHLIYEGPSQIDGAPIVVLATGIDTPSTNIKTGPMLQTYILRSDVRPVEALKTKQDSSICGDCPHRGRACYVNVGQAPTAVYDAYKRGNAKRESLRFLGLNRHVRLGSYGDPCAVPTNVWNDLTKKSVGRTGYTHGWRNSPDLKNLCMASVDNEAEAVEAQALGWRTFRVKDSAVPKLKCEAVCPASEESGKKMQCFQCLACSGKQSNIVINVHGAKWKQAAFLEAA